MCSFFSTLEIQRICKFYPSITSLIHRFSVQLTLQNFVYSFVLKLQLFTTFAVLLFILLHLISNLALVIRILQFSKMHNDTAPLPFCPSLHLPALQYSLCCKAQRTPPPHRSFTPFTPVRALLLGHNRQQGGPLSAWTRDLL